MRGRAAAAEIALFAVVAVLALALATLAWRAFSAGQALREALTERSDVVRASSDLKFRVASLRARQLEYTVAAVQGGGAVADDAPARTAFTRDADALGRTLNELLASHLSTGERAAAEEVHAGFLRFLRTDGQLFAALREGDGAARSAQVTESLAGAASAADELAAAADRLTRLQLNEDGSRADSVYARAHDLRAALMAALACGVVLAAVLVLSWARAMRRHARMSSRIEHYALTDELSGLPNRRAWDERLTAEIARAIRQGSTLSLILLDVDLRGGGTPGERGSADRAGGERSTVDRPAERLSPERPAAERTAVERVSGDRANTGDAGTVARTWKSALRRDDYIAQLAKQQFAFILPACDAAQAAAMAERLHALAPVAQRFSAGVVNWDRRETAEHLMRRAETALRGALADGANPSVFVAGKREASDEDRLINP